MLHFAANYKHFKRLSPEEVLENTTYAEFALLKSTQDLSARLRKHFSRIACRFLKLLNEYCENDD